MAHLWMWFSPRSGVSESRDKVWAIDVSAQNLTNTQWSNDPVAGSLRVRQLCGGIDGMNGMQSMQESDSDTWMMQSTMVAMVTFYVHL